MNKIIVAIDGFSSCGKSTIAKKLAKTVGYAFVDTGAMYRSITCYALQNGLIDTAGNIKLAHLKQSMPDIHISFKNEAGENRTYLNGVDITTNIRTLEVSNVVSKISSIGFVREAMVFQQQEMGRKKGIVMDGRDIGTVVFPDAELKIFVQADPMVRAERRWKELQEKGEHVSLDEVLKNIEERDYFDQNRTESPLKKASDAIVLDNTCMTCEEQDKWVMDKFNEAIQQ